MSTGSSSANEPRARAWFLFARFDLAVHTRLVDSDTNKIFPEYVRELLDARTKYRDSRVKGLNLFTYSMPTSLSSLADGHARGFVPMEAIFQASRLVSERAVLGIFGSPRGFTANWGPLYFGQGESLNDHAAFKKFIRESSLGGMDPELLFRVDYRGVSEARQMVLWKDEERALAWKFEAEIDAAHHAELIHAHSEFTEVRWDYFHLHILQRLENWEETKEAWDLVSYSVQPRLEQIFFPELAVSYHIPVVGYFRHGSDNMRRRDVQGMLDGIPGLTVNWSAVHVGQGGSLA